MFPPEDATVTGEDATVTGGGTFSLVALVLEMVSIFAKHRLVAWSSFAALLSAANTRGRDNNGMAAFGMAIFALFGCYIVQPGAQPRLAAESAPPLPTI